LGGQDYRLLLHPTLSLLEVVRVAMEAAVAVLEDF
jgi:hypothetical protein